MFDCPRCGAAGNQDGTLTVVRHQPDCAHLAELAELVGEVSDE